MDFFKPRDINDDISEFQSTDGAVLVDVRTPEEYTEERIDKSINISLDDIEKISSVVSDKSTPLFVYCRSGNRSGQAVSILRHMGYTNARNIGGITNYKGKTIKGE